MSRLRRFPLVASGAAMATALTVAAAPPAAADSSRCTSDSACAGKVTFQSYGEVFKVYDQRGDGHSAVLLYWLPDGSGPHHVWNHSGNGSVVTANLEFPEGDWVTYRACLGEFGQRQILESTCGSPTTDYA
ncbi:hypothetical protein [Amycolatopsis cihanbeyliensis]|uniref:Peptidase inhibitor family I36 n=1 Tax=Amycolatopsis cihanbeyliensis TaxID=1128664 RepID=A0A542DRJ3_AMYCI|nr:hypothetical protein [Amycolatopsis cihanbeyliensis]TQJ05605.1 hypothetical protein FB471_5442 [Amycolatopsis cihanbeyliensis]